jgi:hypothetical protein
MPHVINYAERWNRELLATVIQGVLCSPFVTNNVRWLNAKTFHFTQMSTTGYKTHSRNGGWNRGTINQEDVPFTLYHDRDVEFLIDKADVDESDMTATIQNVSEKFVQLQANPEIDAEFFSRIYSYAHGASLASATALNTWTTANVFTRLKAMLKQGKLRAYKQRGSLVGYVSSDIMDLLERSTEFTRQIVLGTIADSGLAIQTRITEIDGVPIFEVIDVERFKTTFNFNGTNGGFEDIAQVVGPPATGSWGLNAVFASTEMVKKVPKINSIYFFQPGQHTEGDGYLYQNRAYSGTFVFPNGKDNTIDSIFVDVDAATLPTPAAL